MRIEMYDPQEVIFREIADSKMHQRDVAMTYAFIIRQSPNSADWPKINQAIRQRWKGKTALTRVKEMARKGGVG